MRKRNRIEWRGYNHTSQKIRYLLQQNKGVFNVHNHYFLVANTACGDDPLPRRTRSSP